MGHARVTNELLKVASFELRPIIGDDARLPVLSSYVRSAILTEERFLHFQLRRDSIDVQSLARLVELEALMQNLASVNLHQVLLSNIEDAHWVAPLQEVVLTVSEKDSNVSNDHHGEHLVCKWSESTEGWLESAEKIAAMVASGKPFHQYFNSRRADSVTIELTNLE